MIKQLYDRIKTALGLNKQPGCQIVVTPEVAEFMNKPLEKSHPNALPTADAAPPDPLQTLDGWIASLEDQLKPKLVYSGPGLKAMGKEPDLIDPTNRRCLQKEWLDWCSASYSITMNQAWEVGSKSLIDQEFAHGKMRENVEILKWDPANPLLVRIKYHDPLDPNDDWFDKEEGNE